MYLPKHFEESDSALLLEVMRQYSFATLVSTVEGAHFATHVPVVASAVDGKIRINGHVARANPHWRGLQAAPAALVIFQGPHAYISPTHYTEQNRVPTWNYIAVHATGTTTVHESDAAKLAILTESINHDEPGYQVQFDALAPQYRSAMLDAIVGFTIEVEQLQGKFKLGQHRLAGDKPGLQAWHQAGGENERAIAAWMQRLGYWP